jgi:hypothetical protein
MGIWTPGQPSRQQQKKLIEQQQREDAELREKIGAVAEDVIKVLTDNGITFEQMDMLFNTIKNRFNNILVQQDIKSLLEKSGRKNNNQGDS